LTNNKCYLGENNKSGYQNSKSLNWFLPIPLYFKSYLVTHFWLSLALLILQKKKKKKLNQSYSFNEKFTFSILLTSSVIGNFDKASFIKMMKSCKSHLFRPLYVSTKILKVDMYLCVRYSDFKLDHAAFNSSLVYEQVWYGWLFSFFAGVSLVKWFVEFCLIAHSMCLRKDYATKKEMLHTWYNPIWNAFLNIF